MVLFAILKMAFPQLCLLALVLVCTKSSDVFSNTIILRNGNYNVTYNFNETSETFEFLVEVKATGWVIFGYGLNSSLGIMEIQSAYDLAVGGVLSNGTGYLQVKILFSLF